jgi:hypothetical protein
MSKEYLYIHWDHELNQASLHHSESVHIFGPYFRVTHDPFNQFEAPMTFIMQNGIEGKIGQGAYYANPVLKLTFKGKELTLIQKIKGDPNKIVSEINSWAKKTMPQ